MISGRFKKEHREDLVPAVAGLLDQLKNKPRRWFLPLAEIALPSLRTMSPAQYDEFRSTVIKLVKEDGKVSLFEFTLKKMILCRLDPLYSRTREIRIRHHHLKTLEDEIAVLLSAMAWASGADRE